MDNVPVEEKNTPRYSPDDITEEHDDRMTGTDEEEYIDLHATDCMDPPEGVNFDETHISADEEDDQPV